MTTNLCWRNGNMMGRQGRYSQFMTWTEAFIQILHLILRSLQGTIKVNQLISNTFLACIFWDTLHSGRHVPEWGVCIAHPGGEEWAKALLWDVWAQQNPLLCRTQVQDSQWSIAEDRDVRSRSMWELQEEWKYLYWQVSANLPWALRTQSHIISCAQNAGLRLDTAENSSQD